MIIEEALARGAVQEQGTMAKFSRHELANLLLNHLQRSDQGLRPPTGEEFEAEVQAKCFELWKKDQEEDQSYLEYLLAERFMGSKMITPTKKSR